MQEGLDHRAHSLGTDGSRGINDNSRNSNKDDNDDCNHMGELSCT